MNEPLQSKINPKWVEVEEHVQLLESVLSGSVFLKAANGNLLSIGGDRGVGYVVFLSDEKTHHYLLAPADMRKGLVKLVIGFQPADYPRRIVVNCETSLKVACAFYKTGQIDGAHEWTTDGTSVDL